MLQVIKYLVKTTLELLQSGNRLLVICIRTVAIKKIHLKNKNKF